MERWVGRVALVTGASVGIGAAICKQLVTSGMQVIGAARKVISNELSSMPGSLTAMKCDISKAQEVLDLFSNIKDDFGGIDVCVNNAGLSHNFSLMDGTPEVWQEILGVNLLGLCLCTREAIASMKERNVDDGQIIHINSMSGHRVMRDPGIHFYAATKHAVTALTDGLQQELRAEKSHIRVSSVSPGMVETNFAPRHFNNEAARDIYRQIHSLQPEEIAGLVKLILETPPHMQIQDIKVWPVEQPY